MPKTTRFIPAALIVALLSLAAPAVRGQDMDARELIRRIETQYQGDTSHAVAHMRVVTERWTREMSLEMWSKGRDRFLVRVLAPRKDAGVSTLKVGDDMWNYLPNIDRLIKIPSSMMGESWMGSHLTNDDLVKENQVDRLYDLSMTGGEGTAEIIATPRPGAAVVWGRIIYTVDTERLIPRTIRYEDEDGALVRTITFEEVRRISGRWVPLRMRVQPEDEPKESTILNYGKLEFNVHLSDDFFSIRTLRNR